MDICPSISFICLPHFPDHADLLRKQAGTGARQSGAHSGHAESWQGLPPQMISTGGSFAPSSLVMSPTCRICGNRIRVTAMGNGSISLAHKG